MKVYKIYKCKKRKNISPEKLVQQIAIPLIQQGNKTNTYYKFVLDDVWHAIYDYYDFDFEAREIVGQTIWDCFEKYCDQYRYKYHIE